MIKMMTMIIIIMANAFVTLSCGFKLSMTLLITLIITTLRSAQNATNAMETDKITINVFSPWLVQICVFVVFFFPSLL